MAGSGPGEKADEDEFLLLQAEVEKAAKDLKGKKFVVDKYGNIIPLAPVKAEKLPPYAVPMTTKIQSEEDKLRNSKQMDKKRNKEKKTVRIIQIQYPLIQFK